MNRPRVTEPQSLLFTGWRGAVLVLVVLVSLTLSGISLFTQAEFTGVFPDRAGRMGLYGGAPGHAPGWWEIPVVEPGGAAEAIGLVPGDEVRLPDPLYANSSRLPGTRMEITVRHRGHERRAMLVYRRFDPMQDPALTAGFYGAFVGAVFAFMLGLTVLVRGWGQYPAVVLGMGLTAGASGGAIPAWAIDQPWTTVFVALHGINFAAVNGALLSVVPLLYARHVRNPGPFAVRVTASIVLGFCALSTWSEWLNIWANPAFFTILPAFLAVALVAIVMAVWWAWRGYCDAPPAGRNRFATLLVAFAILALSVACSALIPLNALTGKSVSILRTVAELLGSTVFPLLLVYAVLRHRVIDIGFAFNRTLVYGTFSAILLGSFGLIEWGVEHLLPEEWVKASAWIDAGAAVVVYLAFHRVHDWVEHRVEHLFFRQWQANEDALRQFVAVAPHFEDAGALARAFAEELARFGGGARVAFYRRNEGALNRVAGNWEASPRHFREDDRAFATLRATRRPLDLTDAQTSLPGALALPMIDHGALAGLVLMDLKGNGALYRPDEIALLGWVAHETGLAMAALHVGLVETELRLAKAQLARLGSIIGDRLDRANA